MRVRSEEKRRQIVAVAAQLFMELGYDRTSMSLISERVGGSKATLYGYFRSKEEILQAVLDYDVTEQVERLMNEMMSATSLQEGLVALGISYLTRRLSDQPISNVRIVASHPDNSTIGREFYEKVLRPAWQRLARRFEILMGEGVLKTADPWIAAMHWKGLCEWDMFEKRLLGAISEGDPEEIRTAAIQAADVFLQVYGAPDAQHIWGAVTGDPPGRRRVNE